MRSPLINVMVKAVTRAARGLKRDFGEVENLQVSQKGPADFVSQADMKAEKILIEELKKARPEIGFLMEESAVKGEKLTDAATWVGDPLDGTSNFLHGLPHFAVSLALVERKEPVAGVIYDPIKDELFIAERGKGAYLNDHRLRVSGRKRLEQALLATGIPFKGKKDHGLFLTELEAAMAETAGVRRWGSAALDLAYVAAGRYDGFWERSLDPWDWAAGVLLVREAGGFVTQIDGRSFDLEGPSVAAANADLHLALRKLLSKREKSA
jgi:myo-inositol-1(or 4)-monophosphatase